MNYTQLLLMQTGLADHMDRGGWRDDAKFTTLLNEALEQLRATTYDVKRPTLKALTLIPVDTSVPAGAEVVSYDQFDEMGQAKVIANYADDLPLVDTAKERFVNRIVEIGAAYQITVHDLERARMGGTVIDQRRATAMRNIMDRKLDTIAAVGLAAAGLSGLTNQGNVTVETRTGAVWSSANPGDMYADLVKLHDTVVEASKETFKPDTILLPTVQYNLANRTRLSADNPDTVLMAFMKNTPGVQVDSWHKLATAGAGSVTRAVSYWRNPEALQLALPLPFDQLAPQPRNLALIVPGRARIGGVENYYPAAMRYMDDI